MGQITNNEFLSSVLNAEVWKKVSDESLSMEMIEKFQDKLDWETLSQNRNILWTTAGIAKFAGKINWSDFSQYCNANILTEENLHKFKEKWNWKTLSSRDEIYNNRTLLDKFVDMMDWADIIDNWDIERAEEFIERYQQYIPLNKFQTSRLWDKLVEVKAERLLKETIYSI